MSLEKLNGREGQWPFQAFRYFWASETSTRADDDTRSNVLVCRTNLPDYLVNMFQKAS